MLEKKKIDTTFSFNPDVGIASVVSKSRTFLCTHVVTAEGAKARPGQTSACIGEGGGVETGAPDSPGRAHQG